MPEPERVDGYVIAFDFGLKHIGVAIGQTVSATASGHSTIKAKQGKPRWAEIERLQQDYQPIAFLVGLPLNMDGSESEMSAYARGFAAQLEQRFSTPVVLVDERLTSRAAHELQPGQSSHPIAASLIAETWLSERN